MTMSSKYRISTHSGHVNVQKQWTFLWWSGWSYINAYCGEDDAPYPQDFTTLKSARAYIDKQIARDSAWNQPPIITPYPALGFPNPALNAS